MPYVELLCVLGGAVVGGSVAWTVASLRCRAELVRAQADAGSRLAVAEARLEQVQALRQELEDRFAKLANTALDGSSKRLVELADQRFSAEREKGKAELDDRRRALETLLAPFRETLTKLEARTNEIERAREGAYANLDKHVKLLHEATSTLQEKTTSLATALRSSEQRGRWGELALRNVVEAAGMTEHCDFETQTTLSDGRRPDMVVRLPGGRVIAVDAKAPLDGYLRATEATTPEERDKALADHATALRNHVRALAARGYAATLGADVDLVVLFLPGDPLLAAAFQTNPELQIEALRSKVLISTPTTLVALLRTVAIYWQQQAAAENAEMIAQVARELYERGARFGVHLGRVGKGLNTAVKAFNDAVGSFDSRFLPMARRLDELKVAEQTAGQIDAVPPVEAVVREPRVLASTATTP